MDNTRKDIYIKLKENAENLRELLDKKEFNLAEVDKLFRQRNNLFYQLKDLFVLKEADEEELKFVEGMINDNNDLLKKITRKKEIMQGEFNKKKSDANKISTYLKG
ncbi:hypothetical protein [Hippea jasoniae]|uniref:hypothetical protein n=1 Tax=Hippea jasoniae TaxID=944479 RepID=UPI00054FEF5F|nr:hypothetical protein [Hippea jasoniae]